MYLKVQDETVRRNIEIFKIILKRASHSVESFHSEKQGQDFKAFVHRLRGEIRFADFNSDPVDSKDWIVVSFHFSLPEKPGESVAFEVTDKEGAVFSWDGFQSQALLVLKETVKTIQLMAKFLPCIQNLSMTFREFSQINLDSFLDEIPAKDLIHESWYQSDRQECEKLLSQKKRGTFVFRQDEFAALLESALIQAHKKSIKCITLTYVGALHKISDITLVKKKEGWLIYNDDPCLRGCIYPTVRILLDRFRSVLKVPLLNL